MNYFSEKLLLTAIFQLPSVNILCKIILIRYISENFSVTLHGYSYTLEDIPETKTRYEQKIQYIDTNDCRLRRRRDEFVQCEH